MEFTQANNSLSQLQGPLQNVRISEIEFIELYKDQVILAARALQTYVNKPEFAVNPLLRSRRGGFQRLTYDEPAGWWSRIYVRAGANSSLIFTLPTVRARSEESQQGVQRSNIDGLVAQAVMIPKWDQRLATSMFELMIPNRLKGSFRDLKNILFVLDPQAAHYPWELLYDRRTGQDKPLAVQVGMIRQFTTASFQERVVDVKNKNVLVVGNPTKMPPGFADLPGAQQEASLVADKFNTFGYEVTPEIHSGSNAIMNSLFANDYRVLHLAGHGVYRHPVKRAENEEPQYYTGMVLGEDIFLTANEIESKMDIPELVFINCCHLGTIDNPAEATKYAFNEFAASLSQKLIEMGVKAVIAAGWAVDDFAALTFADEFYEHLLKGSAFGEAVKAARQITYDLHKDRTNTWAAYQCYGDPDYRLVDMKDLGRKETDEFVDIEEALLEIRKLSGLANMTAAQGFTSLQERLVRLQKKIEKECPAWLDDLTLQESLADTLGEMFLFEEAVSFYDRALKSRKSSVSIKTLERLANYQIRLAVREFENSPDKYSDVKGEIEKQIKSLNQLIKTLGASSERWSMVGSGYKRLAQISSHDPSDICNQALEKMETAYKHAWDLEKDNIYPLTNVLVAKVIRLLRANNPDEIKSALPGLADLVKEAAGLAKIGMNASDDFWINIGGTDVTLINYLVDYIQSDPKELREELFDGLVKDYKRTWRRYGSARELNSVIEQYAFLAAVLKGIESHKDLTNVLLKILASLNSISEK